MLAYARGLFGTAAVMNFAIGGGLLFLRPWLVPMLGLEPIAGTNLVLANMTGAMVCLFGFAYAAVALDPRSYHPFIGLGAAGKLMAVVGAGVPWLMGSIPATLPALTVADILFAALFLDYRRRVSTRLMAVAAAPSPAP